MSEGKNLTEEVKEEGNCCTTGECACDNEEGAESEDSCCGGCNCGV